MDYTDRKEKAEFANLSTLKKKCEIGAISEKEALQKLSQKAKEAKYSISLITITIIAENIVISDNGQNTPPVTNIDLIPDMKPVVDNVVQNPNCNDEVQEVVNDTIENIIESTAPNEKQNVSHVFTPISDEEIAVLIEALKNKNSKKKKPSASQPGVSTLYGVSRPPVSIPAAVTKYGVSRPPEPAHSTLYGVTRPSRPPLSTRYGVGRVHSVYVSDDGIVHIKESVAGKEKENNKAKDQTTSIINKKTEREGNV